MNNRYISIIVKIMLSITLLYIVIIAAASSNVHPDETVTKAAIEYYKTNFMVPDMRDLPDDKFCSYGQTRLCELTIYYFIAGKIAALIPYETSYRFFNVLLAFIIVFIIIKNYNKSPFLLFAFFITPQVWYIFSYATSDALDYFFAFVLVYQLAVKSSMLNTMLNSETFTLNKRNIITIILISLLTALILMAKPNYYIVLLLMGYVLLKKYFLAEKGSRRKTLFKIYTSIAVCSLAVFLSRYSIDIYYYGFNKSEIFRQMRIIHAIPMLNPATPFNEMYETMFLAAKDVPLITLFTKYGFLQVLIGSFFGLYGGMNITAHPVYYFIMLAAYLFFFAVLFKYIIKSHNKEKYADGITALILAVISILLVLYYSYFIDFQPQGRYMLPLLPVITYLVSQNKEILQNKYMVSAVMAMGILSHIYVLSTGLKGIFYYNQLY